MFLNSNVFSFISSFVSSLSNVLSILPDLIFFPIFSKIFFKKCIKSLGVIFKLITKKAINPNSKNESNPKSPLKFIITVPSSYPNKPENIKNSKK